MKVTRRNGQFHVSVDDEDRAEDQQNRAREELERQTEDDLRQLGYIDDDGEATGAADLPPGGVLGGLDPHGLTDRDSVDLAEVKHQAHRDLNDPRTYEVVRKLKGWRRAPGDEQWLSG